MPHERARELPSVGAIEITFLRKAWSSPCLTEDRAWPASLPSHRRWELYRQHRSSQLVFLGGATNVTEKQLMIRSVQEQIYEPNSFSTRRADSVAPMNSL